MNNMSALELAIRNERAEIAFYEKEAKRSTVRAASTLFLMLAAQEEHHIRLLEELNRRLTRKGTWPEHIDTDSMTVNIDEVFEQLTLLDGGDTPQELSDIEALKRAIEFEKRAEAFYTKLAKESADKQEEAFFSAIAGFERQHLGWIEAFLAAVLEVGDR